MSESDAAEAVVLLESEERGGAEGVASSGWSLRVIISNPKATAVSSSVCVCVCMSVCMSVCARCLLEREQGSAEGGRGKGGGVRGGRERERVHHIPELVEVTDSLKAGVGRVFVVARCLSYIMYFKVRVPLK